MIPHPVVQRLPSAASLRIDERLDFRIFRFREVVLRQELHVRGF
jgi:hypothetical protein